MTKHPTAIIRCPDCGVECGSCFAAMPSVLGTYNPHQKGSRGCMERQIRNLKRKIEELTEAATGKKHLVLLHSAGRHAIVIDNSPEEALQRAHRAEPDGGWEHASISLITRVRAARTSQVLAMDRMDRAPEATAGKKHLVLLHFADRRAVVIDNSPEEAIQRAHMTEPDGGWEHASISLIARVRATRTAQVLAMDRMDRAPE